jgi:hypothetical protein
VTGWTGKVTEGDKVRLALDGLPPVDGVVDYAIEPFLGVRTATGLYRFMHGYRDTVVVELHDFSDDVDAERTEQAWQAWLTRSFA